MHIIHKNIHKLARVRLYCKNIGVMMLAECYYETPHPPQAVPLPQGEGYKINLLV